MGFRRLAALVAVLVGVGTLAVAPIARASGEPVTLLIQLDPSLGPSEVDAVLAAHGGTVGESVDALGLHEVLVDEADAGGVLAAFDADGAVVSAEVDLQRQVAGAASDPEYGTQWALPTMGWEDVHDVATFAADVSIAVLDTGVDATTPDLAGRLAPGWSFDGSDPGTDPNGHGTHTATIAAAAADDGVGIAGVSYARTSVMPVKVLGADGSGNDSDVIAGLVWAADNGADVAVMPFSNPGYSDALQAAIDYAWASGVVLVAAAGNDGGTEPTYPAGDANVVGVGATGADDIAWASSNRSDAVFLHAPGVDVAASDADGTVNVTGTSASAALTAGAVAVLRSIDPSASNAAIVGRLARTADPLNEPGPGNGRVNLGRASTDLLTDEVTPTGAPGGGPFVGPYVVATARTWTGAGSTNYNNGFNWSPNGVPTALDALTIPGGAPRYPFLNLGTGGGLAQSIVVGNGGSLQVTSTTLAVNGVLTNGVGGSLILSGGGSISVLNNLVNDGSFAISGTSTVTIPQDYSGSGTATMSLGTLKVGRNWRPAGGSFTATGGTVQFTGNADPNATFAAAANQFYDVVVDAGADPRFSQITGSQVNVSHDLTNHNPSLNVTNKATFTFNGTGPQVISSASTAATFGNLVVAKPASTLTLATDAGVAGDVSVTGGTLVLGANSLDRTSAGGTFGLDPGTTLQIGGTGGFPAGFATRSLAPGSLVQYNGTSQPVLAETYGNLSLTGSGTKTMPAGPITTAGTFSLMMSAAATLDGDVTVEGNATFGPNTAFEGGSATLRVRGNFTNQSSAWAGGSGGTVVLDGAATQTIGGLAVTMFRNLTVDNPAGVTLSQTASVSGAAPGLRLLQGNVTTGSQALVITATGSVTRTSGHIVGNLTKQVSSDGTVVRTYEVGTASEYAPVDVTLHGVTGSGPGGVQTLTVAAKPGDHPSLATSGIDPTRSVNLHWSLLRGGTWAFSTFDATLGFPGSSIDLGADPADFIVRRNTGGSWYAATTGTRTATSTESLGHTSFSDLAVGEPGGDATTTVVTCATTIAYGASDTCEATVTAAIPGVAPSGTVTFSTDGSGDFSPTATCTLVPATSDSSTCSVTYSPTAVGTGSHSIGASFSDGTAYVPSVATPALISVTAVPLTVTADDQTKPYGFFDPIFTVTYSGLVNGDTAPATPPTCSVPGPHEEVAGSPYAITCSGAADPNYTITHVDGELTVTPVPLTITADDQSKGYGDADPAFTFTYTGLSNGDTDTATPPTCTVTGPHSAVGTYPITCSGAADANYTITYVDGELTVGTAVLTITADDQTRPYGGTDPAFTFTYSGLTNGDLGPDTPPTCTVPGPHDDAGTYPITCSGAADADYTIIYVDGELDVTPVALTVTADDQTKPYGFFDPIFTVTYSGLVNGDTAPATPPTCSVPGPHEEVAGSPYAITCSGAADPNYTITHVDGELTVTPVPLTITADDQSKGYGDADPAFTFTYTGLSNGDTDTATPPTCTVTGPHSAVGTYPITCSGAADANYTITYVDGTLTVVDSTPPTAVSIVRTSANPTNAASVQWLVTFSEAVTGVGTGDFALTGSGAPGASVTSVSADSGTTRTVTVATGVSGALTLSLHDDDSVVDGAGNPLAGVGTGTVGSGGVTNGSLAGETYTVDKTGPTITITTPPSGATYALNQVVNASYTCTDPSGVATCTGPVADGAAINTATGGTSAFTVNATDSLGNAAVLSHVYSVGGFNFTGFFSPVDNLPTLNSIKAGQAVPVKFSLGGYQGMGIFAPGYPASGVVSCSSTAPIEVVEETVSPGASTLTYDSGTDRYQYVWKTQKSWPAGTCRQLVLKFVDGTTKYANFKLK